MKETVLRGLPPKSPVTVAVNVTGLPWADGFGAEVNVVTVFALLTVCVKMGDVLAAKLALPE
jgi:hypothetical protein